MSLSPAEEAIPFLSEDSSTSSSTASETSQQVQPARFDIARDLDEGTKASSIKRRLYVSHLLSTWNSRVFEFGAVLFLAQIFPGSLLPASVYALLRAASAICLAPTVGRYVDREDRLKVVRFSIGKARRRITFKHEIMNLTLDIVGQRTAVIMSCISFWFLPKWYYSTSSIFRVLWLAILAGLACIEKLCSIMNLVAIERDWVVIVSENTVCGLDMLNSQVRIETH